MTAPPSDSARLERLAKDAFLRAYLGPSSPDFARASRKSGLAVETVEGWLADDSDFADAIDRANEIRKRRARQEIVDALPEIIAALIAESKGGRNSSSAARILLSIVGLDRGKVSASGERSGPTGTADEFKEILGES